MAKFNVGDKVVMSRIGKGSYREAMDNPYDVVGVVEEARDLDNTSGTERLAVLLFDQTIIVQWPNGYYNSYTEDELDLVQ